MIKVLFARGVRGSYKLLLIFMAVLAMYGGVIVSMFDPALGDSLTLMAKQMPELFAAFNMVDAGTTLIEFVSNYLYGFLLVGLPLVFLVLLTSRLVSRYVDRGSMACLLATPNTRARIIATQGAVLLAGLVCLMGFVTALVMAVSAVMFPDAGLDVPRFLMLNVGLLGLLVLWAGICFFTACIFNDSKNATGVGAGVCVGFILIDMLANASDKFDWLRFCTPITLFNRAGLLTGDAAAIWKFGVLYLVGFALMTAGGVIFCKRDIPV